MPKLSLSHNYLPITGKSDHYCALEKYVAHSLAQDIYTGKTKTHEKALCRTGYSRATNWEDD